MIKVLIVDDSAIVRKVLTNDLSKFNDIEVVGSAIDPYVAREKIIQLKPDVITLDIEMPRMDGLSFLRKLMKHHPIPVVIVSSLTPENSDMALKAFSLGAVEVISKPGSTYSTPDIHRKLVRAIRAAAAAKVFKKVESSESTASPSAIHNIALQTTHKILAIGASTGGTNAIESILTEMPSTAPGTVIVQHMPKFFTASFAERLNTKCQMEVREAADNDVIVPGIALIAPGDKHMLLDRSGARYMVKLKNGPAVHHQRPAVDILFYSVAKKAGKNGVGVLLTGMGADGAKGMLAMHNDGAFTIAQDEKTSIVFGMPKEAINLGGVDKVLPLQKITKTVLNYLSTND